MPILIGMTVPRDCVVRFLNDKKDQWVTARQIKYYLMDQGISPREVNQILRQLQGELLVEKVGKGTGTRYRWME